MSRPVFKLSQFPSRSLVTILYGMLPLALAAVAWSAHYGRFLVGHDTMYHLLRILALYHNIAHGNFYPRWVAELYLGFGYPLLNFYAPATYYVAELFHLLGANYINSLSLTLLALTLLAGMGIYRLALDFFADIRPTSSDAGNHTRYRRGAALVATAAYLFAPYLLFNLYVRGAIAELGAQALLPWVLWSFRRLLRDPRPAKYLLWAVLSLAAVAWTHTVSLMLIPPVLVAYAASILWLGRRQDIDWRVRGGWFVAATLMAAALSAFVWLPIILERQFLSTYAQQQVTGGLSGSVMSWKDFVDFSLTYQLHNAAPPQMGVVQVGVALLGILFVAKRNGEWYFMLALMLATLLALSKLSLPIWESSTTLQVIQFPWRLLSITTLPLALLTGGLVTRRSRPIFYLAGTAALVAVIIYVNYPRVDWMRQYRFNPVQLNLTSIAQYEMIEKDFGLASSWYQEFTPRWVKVTEPTPAPQSPVPLINVELDEASSHRMTLTLSGHEAAPLYLSNFFFPGWRATLDAKEELVPYPTTDFGLFSVNIPAGKHKLQIEWQDTWPEEWGRWFSLAAIFLLTLFYLMQPNLRLLALWPVGLSVFVLATAFSTPSSPPPFQPVLPREVAKGISLLGYSYYQDPDHAEHLYLLPYWHVATPLGNFRMVWQLLDSTEKVIAETQSSPYFDTLSSSDWLPNMVVDDGYYMPLPPGLAAGEYTVALGVAAEENQSEDIAYLPVQPIGKVTIARAVAAQPTLPNPQQIHFTSPDAQYRVTLRGYDVQVESNDEKRVNVEGSLVESSYPVAEPGDTVIYNLYWQANKTVPPTFRVFFQLLEHDWQALYHISEPLALYSKPLYSLWNPSYIKSNTYRLNIPANSVGGLYRPQMWIYNPDTQAEFAVEPTDASSDGERIFLPPIKIARRAAPVAPVVASFEHAINLIGYHVEVPPTALQPNSTLTVTLNYQGLRPTPQDQVQFIHLYNPELGMAAQFDTPPQGGGNPTSTWIPGELDTETISMTIGTQTRPGDYALQIGFYDPAAGGTRMTVLDANQQMQRDNQLTLTELEVK